MANRARRILEETRFPTSLYPLVLEPLEEALQRYPLAGFLYILDSHMPPGENLVGRISWLGRYSSAGWLPSLKTTSESTPSRLVVALPQSPREARLQSLVYFYRNRQDLQLERALRRLETLVRRVFFPEDFTLPFRLQLDPLSKALFRIRVLDNLEEARTPELPLWVWERGKWKPIPSREIAGRLRVPVFLIAPWETRKDGSSFLFLSPLGFLEEGVVFSPSQVLVKQGVSPSWARRVEEGEEEAAVALKAIAAKNWLMSCIGD